MAVPIAAAAGKAAKLVAKQLAKKAAGKAVQGGNDPDDDNDRDATIAITAIAIVLIVGFFISLLNTAGQATMMLLPNPTMGNDECYILPEHEDGLLLDNESDYVHAHAPNAIPNPGGGGGGSANPRGGTYAFLPGEEVPEHTGPLVFPVEKLPGFYISSRMGQRQGYYHGGYDYAGVGNGQAKVFAAADGVILMTRVTAASGNEVYTQHRINGINYVTRNVHLYNPPNTFVQPGQVISAGQQIGVVGNTGGNSTGAHLHFEVWREVLNNYVNPDTFLSLNGSYSTVVPALPGSPLDQGQVILPAQGSLSSGAVEVCYTQGGAQTTSPYGGTPITDLYPNGRIPAAALCSLENSPIQRLHCTAARAFDALDREFHKEFGYNIQVTDSYRSYEGQVRCQQDKGDMCATPGTSVHGFGRAVDLGSGINNFDTPTHRWMVQNAPQYGWVLPDWAQRNGAKPEPWHWEFNGSGDGKSPESAKQVAYATMQQEYATWNVATEFQCLNNLWERESNWNYRAQNPTSSAYGIPQSLPGSKMASHGNDWRENPVTQIRWGLDYIAGRYGNPCSAWQHSENHNWY